MNKDETVELINKLEEAIKTIENLDVYEIVLYGVNDKVIYKGNNDFHEIAHTIHDYLNTSDNFNKMGIDEDKLLRDIKREALYIVCNYTEEQADAISEVELGKMLVKNDSLLDRYEDLSNEYYYDLVSYFVK